MGRRKKHDKPPTLSGSAATKQATILIACYGINRAERIARMTWEKILAQKKGLERKPI